MMNKVTYGQLGKALSRLGFEKVERDAFVAFRNDEYDAVIALPKGTSATVVSPVHLLTMERTVVGKGIASSENLSRAVRMARRPRAKRVLRANTAMTPKPLPARPSTPPPR